MLINGEGFDLLDRLVEELCAFVFDARVIIDDCEALVPIVLNW